MKRFKSILFTLSVTMGLALFISSPEDVTAQTIETGGTYVCCKSISDGCTDILGNFWPTDYKYNMPTCPKL